MRLNEFDSQVRAIRHGLTSVIPSLYFGFWPWRTLERKVWAKKKGARGGGGGGGI